MVEARVPEENTDFYSNKVITMATISEGGWVCQTQFLEDHPKTPMLKSFMGAVMVVIVW
jgi:hypothetical protein